MILKTDIEFTLTLNVTELRAIRTALGKMTGKMHNNKDEMEAGTEVYDVLNVELDNLDY